MSRFGERLALEYSAGVGPCVLLLHGFGEYKNLGIIDSLYSFLVAEGRFVARVDFSGNGESEGLFGESTFSKQSQEVIDVMNYLSEECSAESFVLVGHSMGGSVALLASSDSRVEAVACLGAPSRPAMVAGLHPEYFRVGAEVSVPRVKGVDIVRRAHVISEQWFANMREVDVLGAVPSDKPVFAFHGENDQVVPLSDAQELEKRGAQLVVLDTDHFFLGYEEVIAQHVLSL